MTDVHDERVSFDDLVDIMATLRGPDGCPWDRKQTLETIKDYFTEEVYEALEAIDEGDFDKIREELGDVLFEVCFLARLCEENGRFTVYDSIRQIHDKLIRRHPHVFGDEKVTEAEEVPGRWAKLKAQEKRDNGERVSILDGVPKRLPPLLQALRISERAVAVGFEWETAGDVLEKLEEEIAELKEAIELGEPRERLEDELGDVLFTAVNVGRKLEIGAHDSLTRTMNKFRTRFGWMERRLREQGKELEEQGIEQLEMLWQAAKRVEREK